MARAAGLPDGAVGAVYDSTDAGSLALIGKPEASLALVTFPSDVEHARAGLAPRLRAVGPTGATETWALVAKKRRPGARGPHGRLEIVSPAGYAKRFVLGPALGRSLGRASGGRHHVLDPHTLGAAARRRRGEGRRPGGPRADRGRPLVLIGPSLEVVYRSKPMPESVFCTIGSRLPKAQAESLLAGLARLHERPENAELLKTMRTVRFEPVDAARSRRSPARQRPPGRVMKDGRRPGRGEGTIVRSEDVLARQDGPFSPKGWVWSRTRASCSASRRGSTTLVSVLALTSLGASGCARALKEPRPLPALARNSGRHGPSDVDALLARADAIEAASRTVERSDGGRDPARGGLGRSVPDRRARRRGALARLADRARGRREGWLRRAVETAQWCERIAPPRARPASTGWGPLWASRLASDLRPVSPRFPKIWWTRFAARP